MQDDANKLVISSVDELDKEIARGHIFLAVNSETGEFAGCIRCLMVANEDIPKYMKQFDIPNGKIIPTHAGTFSPATKELICDPNLPDLFDLNSKKSLLWYVSGFIIARRYRGQRGLASGLADFAFKAQRTKVEHHKELKRTGGIHSPQQSCLLCDESDLEPRERFCIMFGTDPEDVVVRPLAARLWQKLMDTVFDGVTDRVRFVTWEHERPDDGRVAHGNLISFEPSTFGMVGTLASAVDQLTALKSSL